MGRRGRSTTMLKRPLGVDPSLNDQPESSNPSMKKTQVSNEIATELANLAALGNTSLDIAKNIPRRSQRIQNGTPSEGQDVEPIFENVEASESEEDHQNSYEKRKALEEALGSTSMEEKMNKLILLLEEQGRTTEALFSKVSDWCFPTQSGGLFDSRAEMRKDRYKNMYLDSQKKIDDLKNENNELRKKLETALAKLEGYEKGQLVLNESIEKLKDACLVSNLTRTTEMVLGLSSAREILGHFAAPTSFTATNPQATKKRVVKKARIKKGTDSGPSMKETSKN